MSKIQFIDKMGETIITNFDDLSKKSSVVNLAIEQLVSMFPDKNRPPANLLKKCIDRGFRITINDYYKGNSDKSKKSIRELWTFIMNPEAILAYLPKNRQPSRNPWRLIYIYSEYFESFLSIYGETNNDDLVISAGAVDYYSVTNLNDYDNQRWCRFSYIPLDSQIANVCHKTIGFLDGAHAAIIAKPKVSKKDVLKGWTSALINANILGKKYIASIGTGMADQSMNLITDLSYKYILNDLHHKKIITTYKRKKLMHMVADKQFRQLQLKLGVNFLLFAIGTSEKLWGIPTEKWKTPGYSPVVAIIYLIKDTYVRNKYFSLPEDDSITNSTATFNVFLKSSSRYSSVDNAITTILDHDYASDIGIQITGIMDQSHLIVNDNKELPRNLIRYVNAREEKNIKEPLEGVGKRFHVQEINLKSSKHKITFANANILILTPGHRTLTKKDAKQFTGKIVIEASPYAASHGAYNIFNKPDILFIPFTLVNIGWSYALRLIIIHGYERTPEYNNFFMMQVI